MSKKSKRLINTGLFLLATAFAVLSLELIFRAMLFSDIKAFSFLRSPYEYAPNIREGNLDYYDEDFWKLNYLFNRQFVINDPHPLLGWTGAADKKTFKHREEDLLNGRRPVLLFGDSFAQCVDSVDCFEEILNSDPEFSDNHFLLNYGVGGYGVDQIYLLFNEAAGRFKDPFIIFSMLTVDLDRSMLKVRDAQKPYFELTENGLILKGVPITLSSDEYFRQNPPEIRSFLWNKFKNSPLYPSQDYRKEEMQYIEEVKKINKAILQVAFQKLKNLNTPFLVLIFHPEHYPENDWRLVFLMELCRENNVPFICDLDIKNMYSAFSNYDPEKFSIPIDCHPTTYLNTIISQEIKQCVINPGYMTGLLSGIEEQRRKPTPHRVYHIRKQILNTPDWLKNIREKAAQKGIPPDSMILIDAIYMAELEKSKQ